MRTGNLSNWLYANENPPHFIHEMKTKAYDVTDVNVFLRKKMPNWCLLYNWSLPPASTGASLSNHRFSCFFYFNPDSKSSP